MKIIRTIKSSERKTNGYHGYTAFNLVLQNLLMPFLNINMKIPPASLKTKTLLGHQIRLKYRFYCRFGKKKYAASLSKQNWFYKFLNELMFFFKHLFVISKNVAKFCFFFLYIYIYYSIDYFVKPMSVGICYL